MDALVVVIVDPILWTFAALDQPAFNRNRLKAEKLIDSKVLEQLIRVQADAGCSSMDRNADIKSNTTPGL
jgi:hypothetical protein